ncbi:unnamed protein product [Lactuca saligna]|uniref:DUF223 domain-containing protein n=1 Tax=Lactuca saligna TaxID=75948 RepID=A0AA35ZXP4_LACSI|nr:unnamed protein product [Lactuca saligna]
MLLDWSLQLVRWGRDNNDIKKHRLNIQIQDANGLQLSVHLWGDFAYKMQGFLDNNPHNLRIIVIIQFAKLSIWRDRPTGNTYFSVSRLFINTYIDEINVFKKSLDGDDRPDSSTNTFTLMKSNKVSEHDDFMVKFQLKTIVDVSEPVEVGNSQSFDIGEANSESQDNRILKDAISGTDGNIIPSTVDKNSATSPMKGFNTPTVLKRNLEEVFDLELNENLSSSKTPKISSE